MIQASHRDNAQHVADMSLQPPPDKLKTGICSLLSHGEAQITAFSDRLSGCIAPSISLKALVLHQSVMMRADQTRRYAAEVKSAHLRSDFGGSKKKNHSYLSHYNRQRGV